jgi:hypothetical protein
MSGDGDGRGEFEEREDEMEGGGDVSSESPPAPPNVHDDHHTFLGPGSFGLTLLSPPPFHDPSTPMKRIATPLEVAYQVSLMSSDTLTKYTTGQIVMVVGGMEGQSRDSLAQVLNEGMLMIEIDVLGMWTGRLFNPKP